MTILKPGTAGEARIYERPVRRGGALLLAGVLTALALWTYFLWQAWRPALATGGIQTAATYAEGGGPSQDRGVPGGGRPALPAR